MFPWQVDPDWYEKHWLTELPPRNRPRFRGPLARLVVAVALLAGGGAALSHFYHGHTMSDYPAWQQE